MTAFHSDKYEREVIEMYRTPTVDYTKDVTNQSLKRGATHIVYCSGKAGEIDPVPTQNDLIQLFGNPRGNAKDKRAIPIPESQIQSVSKAVFSEFLSRIEQTEAYLL